MTDFNQLSSASRSTGEVRTLLGGRRWYAVAFQAGSALVAGISLAWLFYGMRAVMEVGGSCADGGPYVSAQPCPDGAALMGIGMPVMMLAVLSATFIAVTASTPLPVFPMWAVLFTTLGANFLEFGFEDPKSASWIFCGFLFIVMAIPGWIAVGWSLKSQPTDQPGQAAVRIYWISIYLGLGAIGWGLGWWSFDAWA